MSEGSGGRLRALLTAILDVLGQRSRESASSRTTPRSGSPAPVAEWKSSPGKTTAPAVRVDGGSAGADDESPGSSGPGATRDLTAAEIRALRPSYAPHLNGDPDPGEVVWTWVPYVENDGRGKDRPVLIIAKLDGAAWAACYLSTKQHRDFVSVGTGPWDSKGRESFLSPERVLRVTDGGMRRESTGLSRERFERAVTAVMSYHGL